MTDLVDKCEKKSKITFTLSTTSLLLESAFQPRIAPVTVATLVLTVNAGEKKIDKLTEMMRNLAFSVRTLKQNASIRIVEPWATANLAARNRNVQQNSGNSSRPGQTSSFLSGGDKYLYCWEADYYLKRDCETFQDDLNSSRIHLNKDKKVLRGKMPIALMATKTSE